MVLLNEWQASLLTACLALAWLQFTELLASKNVLPQHTCRKLVHIGTGPIFMACWLFFPDRDPVLSSYWAAAVPALISLRFALIGLGVVKDEKTVRSMSRTGRAGELLRGPLSYGIIFVVSTIAFWKFSSLGVTALMLLCAGDGFADLIGRQFGGSNPLPWSKKKSFAGSLGFFCTGFVCTAVFLQWFAQHGLLWMPSYQDLALVSLIATVVESLPVQDWDNITVFLAVVAAGRFLKLT